MKRKIISFVMAFIFAGVSVMPRFALAEDVLPDGGSFVNSSGQIIQNGQVLNVSQMSQRAIVEWKSFCIANGYTVNFDYAGASSVGDQGVILNRVIGSNPSNIFGTIDSKNVKVFLVNPNGILFGGSARVNAPGLIASTLGISNDDFLSGNYTFAGAGGSVINQGRLEAPGGYISLLGSYVDNSGVILAPMGSIALAVGEKMTLGLDPRGLISVTVDEAINTNGSGADSAIQNTGTISANGGTVMLTARALEGVFKRAINNEGIIEAVDLESNKGSISLIANEDGSVVANAGLINAGDVEIKSGGDVANSGDVLAQRGVVIEAARDVSNSSLVQGTDISITAGRNVESSGTISTGSVATGSVKLVSGGDTLVNRIKGKLVEINAKTINGLLLSGTSQAHIEAETLKLFAQEGIGTLGSGLFTDVNNLYATNASGKIRITDVAGDLNVVNVTNNDDVSISSDGNMLLGYVKGSNVDLSSVNGSIVDNNGASLNIEAQKASLSAKLGIGSGNALETKLSQLSARVHGSSATDNIEIANIGSLSLVNGGSGFSFRNFGSGAIKVSTVGDLTISNNVKANRGDIQLTGNSIFQNADVTTSGTGSITFNALAGDIIMAPGTFTGMEYPIIFNGGFEDGLVGWLLNHPEWAEALSNSQASGGVRYDPIEGSLFLRLMTGVGLLDYVTASQSINLGIGDVLSGWAAFHTTEFEFNDNAYVRIYDSNHNLVSTLWYADVESVGYRWDGNGGGDGAWTPWSWTAPSSGTYTLEFGATNVGLPVLFSAALFDNIKISGQGTGTITYNATGNIALSKVKTDGNVFMNAGGSISNNSNPGDINIDAHFAKLIANQGIGFSRGLTTTIDELFARNNVSGDINIDDLQGDLYAQEVVNSGGNVNVSSIGDLLVGYVEGADVSLASTTGSISDDYDLDLDIKANNLTLAAAGNIGSPDVLELNVDSVSATAGGNIDIEEANGALFNNISAGGSINILTNGPSVVAGITAGDLVYIHNTFGDLTFSGVVESLTGGVGIDVDNGSILTTTAGPHIIAQGDSFISVPNGKITPTGDPLNVNINGNLLVDLSNLAMLIPDYAVYGNMIGVVNNGSSKIPTLSPTKYPSPLNPPGFVYFNGIQIWPPIDGGRNNQLASASNENLNKAYWEILAPFRYVSGDLSTRTFFLYHPLREADQSAFDGINLDSDAYEFIEENINLKKDLNPYFESLSEKEDQETTPTI